MDEDNGAFENSKIIRSIWKNTFDKILEIKVSNKRTLKEMKTKIMEEEKKKIENKYQKEYNDAFIKKKIEISSTKNNANLLKMKTKNELVTNIINETLNKLKTFASPTNKEYKDFRNKYCLKKVKVLEKGIKCPKFPTILYKLGEYDYNKYYALSMDELNKFVSSKVDYFNEQLKRYEFQVKMNNEILENLKKSIEVKND